MAKSKSAIHSIEELTTRFRKLDTEKTRVQTLLDSASQRLEELLEEAEEKFGTRDLKELKSKLKDLERENLTMKKQYQAQLESVEEKLARLDNEFESQESTDE